MPPATIFSGGICSPSWKVSFAAAVQEAGSKAPTSMWCALIISQNISRPSTKTGREITRSPTWVLPR